MNKSATRLRDTRFLTDAHNALTNGTHLQTQIDLWLAELHLERGEPSATEEALSRAEDRLSGSERKGLQARARRVRGRLGEPTVKGIITLFSA